jgi:hypothetical protein
MILKKFFPQLTAVFVLTAIVGFYHEAKATEQLAEVAQSIKRLTNSLEKELKLPVLPSPGAPKPGRRQDAGSRDANDLNLESGSQSEEEKFLTAFVPKTNGGQTISNGPTFWVYIPSPSDQVYIGEFLLLDNNDEIIYQKPVTLPQQAGIIGLELPKTVIPSEGEYNWYFRIYDNQDNLSLFVRAVVELIQLEPEIIQQIQMASSSQERLNLYAEHGLWYDIITLLAQEQGSAWVDLLESEPMNLGDFAEEPIFRTVLPEP